MSQGLLNALRDEGVERVYIKQADAVVSLTDIEKAGRIDRFDERFHNTPDEDQYVIKV